MLSLHRAALSNCNTTTYERSLLLVDVTSITVTVNVIEIQTAVLSKTGFTQPANAL